MNFTIRLATIGDAPNIHAAEQETALQRGCLVSYPEELQLEAFEKRIRALHHSGRYVVAETKNRIVGHACLAPMGLKAIAHVFRLTIVVHPGYRGQRIGTALLSDLLQWAQVDTRVQKVELLVRASNKAAIRLYLNHGFLEEGRLHKRICLPDGTFVDDITMAWFPNAEQLESALSLGQQLKLEPAGPDDASAILAIHYAAVHQTAALFYPKSVIEAWSRDPTDEARIKRVKQKWIENPNHRTVVAKINEQIVGFGFIHTKGELQGVYVLPTFGRQGIGGKILVALEASAISSGLSQLWLNSSLNAEAFYKRYGFEVVEQGTHQLNSGLIMDCIKMRKQL